MSGPGGVSGRNSVAGVILFPPMLGVDRTGAVPRARLANTIRTAAGDFTIVFLGDRAEVAERLLRDGGREVEAVGSWSAEGTAFHVERFDVVGAEQRHPYQLDQPPAGVVPRDVDLSGLYGAGPKGPGAGVGVGDWPEGVPSPPSEEFAESERLRQRRPQGSRRAPAPAGERRAPQGRSGFAPGQRVVARDRGNVGTVVAVDAERDEVQVRFVASSGTSAVVSFPTAALDLRGPARPGQPVSPKATDARRRPVGERRQTAEAADHWGPAPGSGAVGGAPQRRRAGQSRQAPDDRSEPRRSGQPTGRANPAEGPPPPPPPLRVLRVHSRRLEPTGELLL